MENEFGKSDLRSRQSSGLIGKEALPRNGFAGARFEVSFKCASDSLRLYSDVRLESRGQIGFRGKDMSVLVGFDTATQIVRRSDIYVIVAELEKIDIPHGVGLPTLLRSFGRHPSPCQAPDGLPPEARQGEGWRRERDSNPRYGFPYTHFPGVRLQPLGHPSGLLDAHAYYLRPFRTTPCCKFRASQAGKVGNFRSFHRIDRYGHASARRGQRRPRGLITFYRNIRRMRACPCFVFCCAPSACCCSPPDAPCSSSTGRGPSPARPCR